MARKTKPVYLIIAGVLLFFVAVIFVFLLTQAYSANAINKSASIDQQEPKYHNQYKTSESIKLEPTEKTIVDDRTIDNVIKVKGLCADKKGNVYDKNHNTYTVTDKHIAVVFEGEVYKIPVNHIQKVNPTIEDTKSSSKQSTSSTSAQDATEVQRDSYEYNNSTGTSSQTNDTVIVSQSQNVVRESNSQPDASKNIKMNYKALSVKNGSLFSLVLTGADSSVTWQIEDEYIQIYQSSGNQCSFTTLKKGTTQVIAKYKNTSYSCTITIT